jgi:hypothetical protein
MKTGWARTNKVQGRRGGALEPGMLADVHGAGLARAVAACAAPPRSAMIGLQRPEGGGS